MEERKYKVGDLIWFNDGDNDNPAYIPAEIKEIREHEKYWTCDEDYNPDATVYSVLTPTEINEKYDDMYEWYTTNSVIILETDFVDEGIAKAYMRRYNDKCFEQELDKEEITKLNNALDSFILMFDSLDKVKQLEFIDLNPFLHSIYEIGKKDGVAEYKNE